MCRMSKPVSLQLMPSYRGFTIDSIQNLTSFDDIIITADEKHDFKGMCKRSEVLKNEARVSLKIPFVKGLPNPVELDEVTKSIHNIFITVLLDFETLESII